MRPRRAVPLALVSTLLPGCLGVVPFQPRAYDEAVRVEAVDVAVARDGAGALTLKLQVVNPSGDAATLTRVDFDLRLDGRRVTTGEQVMGVPLDGKGRLPLEVRFPLALPRGAGNRPEPGSHVARLEGGVVLRFGGSERRAPFHDERPVDIAWPQGGEPRPSP